MTAFFAPLPFLFNAEGDVCAITLFFAFAFGADDLVTSRPCLALEIIDRISLVLGEDLGFGSALFAVFFFPTDTFFFFFFCVSLSSGLGA